MNKYLKILVAVDGSEASLHALRETFGLTRTWITVVSVIPPYEGDLRLVGVRNIQALMREPCEIALAKAKNMAEAEGAFIKTVCEVGEPHKSIADLAEGENCDLIVMGVRGQCLVQHDPAGEHHRPRNWLQSEGHPGRSPGRCHRLGQDASGYGRLKTQPGRGRAGSGSGRGLRRRTGGGLCSGPAGEYLRGSS